MNTLSKMGVDRCIDLLSLKNETHIKENEDFYIGPYKRCSLTIFKQIVNFRDFTVFGELKLESTDTDDRDNPVIINARDCILAGNLKLKNIEIRARYILQPKNINSLMNDINNLVMEWFEFQRESVQKIGLQSILI